MKREMQEKQPNDLQTQTLGKFREVSRRPALKRKLHLACARLERRVLRGYQRERVKVWRRGAQYFTVQLGVVVNLVLGGLDKTAREKGRHLKYSDSNKDVIAENDLSDEMSDF